jgi:putative ABC transport system permease protein
MPADQANAWKEDRRGAIAGASLAQKHGWKIGDLITIKGDIYPVDLEVTLRGTYTAPSKDDEAVLVFHHDYLEELTGRRGIVGTYWIRVDTAESMVPVAKAIDAKFENSDAETLTETEQQFNADSSPCSATSPASSGC